MTERLAPLARALNRVRIVFVNLVFLGLVAAVLAAVVAAARGPTVPESAALLLQPKGQLVEQWSDPVGRARLRLLGEGGLQQTRLRDLLRAISLAGKDSRIKAIVLDTDGFGGGGMPALQAVRQALRGFEKTGKKVYAVGTSYDQAQYYLASAADTVLLDPEGEVLITGFAQYLPYFKDLLDRLRIDVHVFRVGRYKSAVEPFTRDGMSAPAKEETQAYLDALWQSYQRDITASRNLQEGAVARYVADAVPLLESANGDAAKLAVKSGLVTAIATRNEIDRMLVGVVGEDTDTHSYRSVDMDDYLAAAGTPSRERQSENEVALITAAGEITSGSQDPGSVDPDTMVSLLRKAEHDPRVKAVVLRVDSPGGSAAASAQILDEIVAVKAAGKPVVVSMANVAASGGYWISMAADEIWAAPTTLTGSIGIFGIFPTFDKLLDRIDVRISGIGTTDLAGQFSPLRPLSENAQRLIQLAVQRGYREFIARVAAFRHLDPARVEEIAQGRVWTGAQARQIGLVDHLGGLDDALAAAARRAGLKTWTVHRIAPPLGFGARLVAALASDRRASVLGGMLAPAGNPDGPLESVVSGLKREARMLATATDPKGVYVECMCDWRLGR